MMPFSFRFISHLLLALIYFSPIFRFRHLSAFRCRQLVSPLHCCWLRYFVTIFSYYFSMLRRYFLRHAMSFFAADDIFAFLFAAVAIFSMPSLRRLFAATRGIRRYFCCLLILLISYLLPRFFITLLMLVASLICLRYYRLMLAVFCIFFFSAYFYRYYFFCCRFDIPLMRFRC